MALLGFGYGPSYCIIHQLSAASSWSLSEILPKVSYQEYDWEPGVVDAALQTSLGIAYANQSTDSAHLPFSIKCIKSYAPLGRTRFIYVLRNPKINTVSAYHLFFLDENGCMLAMMQDFIGRWNGSVLSPID